MNSPDTIHILLIHPPVVSPSAPPWIMANILGYLDKSGISLETYDANLEFFRQHLFTSEHLKHVTGAVEEKKMHGVFKKTTPAAASLLADFSTEHEKWAQKLDNIDRDLQLLRTANFFQPERRLASIGNIDDLLRLTSLAYHPIRIAWDRCFFPAVKDWEQAAAFIDDVDGNPFLPFCRSRLAARLEPEALRLLILCVSTPGQVLAALTIARFSKQRRQNLCVAMLGDNDLLAGAVAFDISVLPETDPEPMLNLVDKLSETSSHRSAAPPNFSGLPLQEYLSPAVVLPVRSRPADISGDVIPPQVIADAVTTYQQTDNAAGFLSLDDRLKPAYVAQRPMAEQQKTLSACLGLSCFLDASVESEAMVAAYQAGVRLIQWHHPSGPLESVTKILWDASKAGIWNHVIMPDRPEHGLDRKLLQFMAANPNIVHSWVRCQQQSLPFSDAVQRPEKSDAYTNVASLPGRPLWHFFSDPAHLLLYLNRYGAKKMLRWRVRDKASKLYALGENISYYFVKPQELPAGYLDDICAMVEAGGSVDIALVRYNLERAYLIGYALEEGVIVGNSSLKRPRSEYVEAVNRQSGLDLSNYLERGYTSVRPEYRGMGIGATLLEGLTERVGDLKLFSIISADNVAAQKMALRNQTRQVASFYSEKLGKEVGVWMPEWMIED